jgi:hypothetical protein
LQESKYRAHWEARLSAIAELDNNMLAVSTISADIYGPYTATRSGREQAAARRSILGELAKPAKTQNSLNRVSPVTNLAPDPRNYPHGEAFVLEAHMRRTLSIALVLAGVFLGVMISPSKTVPETNATNKQVIYGLHVALPHHMKNFPEELVPLP